METMCKKRKFNFENLTEKEMAFINGGGEPIPTAEMEAEGASDEKTTTDNDTNECIGCPYYHVYCW